MLRKHTNTHAHKLCSVYAQQRKPKTRTLCRLCIFFYYCFFQAPAAARMSRPTQNCLILVLLMWTVVLSIASIIQGLFIVLFFTTGQPDQVRRLNVLACWFVCSVFEVKVPSPITILIETANVFDRLYVLTPFCRASVHSCGFTSSTAGEKSAPACGLQGPTRSPSVETKQCSHQTGGLGVVHFLIIFFIFFLRLQNAIAL